MSEPAADHTAAKQAYLRKHIAAEKYEDFAEFCEATAGSIDIENWTVEFVYELVDKFKRSEAEKAKNHKKTGAFHLYQTGSDDELKEVSNRLKKEREEKPLPAQGSQQEEAKVEEKAKAVENAKTKEEKSALDVLDSIFKNQPAEKQTKKYDKAFFESCNFWGVPAEEPHSKEKNTATPTKGNKTPDSRKFTSQNPVIQPENFEKMFQTGFVLPEPKQASKEKQKTPKKEQKSRFEEIPIEQDAPSRQSEIMKSADKTVKASPPEMKKREIKLVSVKDIRSPKQSKLPFEGEVLIREPFKTTVACFKSFERAALSAKDLRVEITDHEIITRSFFSSDYPMFHLKVLPANIICKRNLEDFQKLRRNLEGVYPGVRLPFLQKLGWLESETSAEFIQRQKKYLAYFLEDVLQNNELKNSRLLEDFLTLRDHKQMKRKFEEYDRMKRITSIEELCLLEGEVRVEFSENTRQYNELLQGFLAKLRAFWAEQERILVQVAQMQAALAESYRELHGLIEGMGRETREFNKRVRFNEAEQLEESFSSLGEYISESMKVSEKEAEFLQQQALIYLRYEKENLAMFEPVLATRNDLTRAYLRRREAERGSDREEYLSERLQECKNGVLEESSSITVLKYQCGYINSLLADEGQRYFTLLSSKIEQMISDICYSKLDCISHSINTFTALVNA